MEFFVREAACLRSCFKSLVVIMAALSAQKRKRDVISLSLFDGKALNQICVF